MDEIIDILTNLELREFCGKVKIVIDGGYPVDVRVDEDDTYGDDDNGEVPDLVDIFEDLSSKWD
jgi:hypothetical protein